MTETSIYLAEDHPIVLRGLENYIKQKEGYLIVGSSLNGAEALDDLLKIKPDIVMLDIYMPLLTGIEITERLLENNTPTKVILLTTYKEKLLLDKAKRLKVSGYLLKDFAIEEIDKCLDSVAKGETFFSKHLDLILKGEGEVDMDKFTKTELSIIKLIAEDKSTAEIAKILFSSPKTIENHRGNIAKKLDLDGKSHNLYKWVIKHRAQIIR